MVFSSFGVDLTLVCPCLQSQMSNTFFPLEVGHALSGIYLLLYIESVVAERGSVLLLSSTLKQKRFLLPAAATTPAQNTSTEQNFSEIFK